MPYRATLSRIEEGNVSPAPTLRVALLGEPKLMGPDGPIRIPALKGQALLWYLAAQGDRTFSRSHLAALLWEDQDETAGRHNLASLLHRLRPLLPVWPLRGDKDTLGWDPAGDADIDVVRFLQLAGEGPGAAKSMVMPPHPREAVDLWRGPFLDGFHVPDSEAYDDWLRQERQRWGDRVLEVLDRLARAAEAAADWNALAGHARRALDLPLQERFHRWLMIAHYQAGDRAAALAQYDTCQDVLRAEIGVEPDPATTVLREAIATGSLPRREAAGSPTHGENTGPFAIEGTPPLVGREEELARLSSALARASVGAGRVVLLHGEAGIGKTRLVEETLWRVRHPAGGFPACQTLLVGHCYETTRDLPYAPFVEALSRLLPALDATRLNLPAVWLAEVGRLLPDMITRCPDLPPPQRVEPGQEQHRLYEGVARFLAALPRPTLLALEDIHWADETSLTLLAFLARHPALHGVAILATTREEDLPEEASHLLRQLRREGRLVWQEVGALSAAAIQALVAAVTGRENTVLGDRIYEETQGNPLFAVEVLRSLQESGRLERQAAEPTDVLPIPDLVQDVLCSRLDRLPESALNLLSAAAIFLAPVPFGLLREVTQLPEEAAVPALETLLRAGILREASDNPSPATGPAIRFGHDLMARVVREGLSRTKRERLHRRAYHVLVSTAEKDGQTGNYDVALSEALAFHATAGGLWDEGLAWNLRAAEAAGRVYAYAAVVRFLEQALSNQERLPVTPERRRQRIDIHLSLARADFRHRPARSEHWLAVAETEVSAADEPEFLNQTWLDRAPTYVIQGHLSLAATVLDRLLPVARRSGNKDLLASGLTYLGWLKSMCGEFNQGTGVMEEAISLHLETGNDLQAGESAATLIGFYASLGEFGRAEALAGEWTRKARDMGNLALTAFLVAHQAFAAHFSGRWAEAVAASREALGLARETEQQMYEYVASVSLGLPLARLGHLEEGIRAQEESIRLSTQVGMRILLDRSYAWLAEMRLQAGEVAAAETAASKGVEIAEKDGYPFGIALNTRVLGQIAAAAGDRTEARRHIAPALERFSTLGARPETARCHALLADLAETEAERVDHRHRAEALFREIGMAWDLERLYTTAR